MQALFIMVRERKIIKNRIRGASGDSRRKEPSSLRLTPLDAPSSERTASSRIFVILGHGRPAASAPWPARRIIISHLVTDQRTRSFAASAATNQCEPAVSGWFSPRTPRRRFSPARRPRRIFVRMRKKNATRPVRCIRHHRRPFSAVLLPSTAREGLTQSYCS